MSAPQLEPATSVSSSGHTDGLGRRALAFDRETGAMLERLYVRPELAAFESAIRERVARLVSFEDDRFGHTYAAERDPSTGELTVVSYFSQGARLSDILEAAREQGIVPGVDVALGYLLDALPAIAALHSTAGFPHGLIDPERTLLTSDGELIFTDAAYGAVVERLGLSRRRLWSEFGIAAASQSGPCSLDAAGDVSQAVLSAVMLVLGRTLGEADGPDSLPGLLLEVVEVAQIRGSSAFASGLQRFLQRSLPLPGRRPYSGAEEAAAEVRQLLRAEIGVDACRQALADFVRQMHGSFGEAASDDYTGVDDKEEFSEETLRLLASLEEEERPKEPQAPANDGLEFDLDLDEDAPHAQAQEAEDEEVYELPAIRLPIRPRPVSPDDLTPDAPVADGRNAAPKAPEPHDAAPETSSARPEEPAADGQSAASALFQVDYKPDPDALAPVVSLGEASAPPPDNPASATQVDAAPPDSGAQEPPAEASAPEAASVSKDDARGSSSRRKRQQQKSARARKDKLRSTNSSTSSTSSSPSKPEAAPAEAPAASVPAAAAPAPSKSGWLVPPERAAKFDPPIPDPTQPGQHTASLLTPAVPAPFTTPAPAVYAPAQPVVSYQAPPMAPTAPGLPLPQVQPAQSAYHPSSAGIPMPRFGVPPGGHRPAPAQPAPQPAATLDAGVVKLSTVKVKAEPPAGYVPTARPRRRAAQGSDLEPVAPLPHVHRAGSSDSGGAKRFPWKLAIGFLVLVAAAIGAGRYYIPGNATLDEQTEAAAPAPAAQQVTAPAVQPKGTGQIVVVTQPAGAKVLLDGTPAGESPVTLNAVPAGRHVLTFVTSSGSVKRTVKVTAARSLEVETPLFSGWLAVFAPVVLDVVENGKSLGTTEQGKLMIAPGHHRLSLTNRDLAYTSEQDVDVTAGETSTIRLDPKGRANFNAVPWAEVWMDGKKIGDTPIANYALSLGSREFVFKNPQLGERRVTATIRGDQPVAVSVDFAKPLQP